MEIRTDHKPTNILIDKNSSTTTAGAIKGAHIDIDQTGIIPIGQTLNVTGLDLDINTDSPTHGGNLINIGIDLDMTAGTSGTQYNTGMNIKVAGADYNTGLYINATTTHIKMVAGADPVTDYATLTVADTGDLTIATTGDGSTDSDIILDADGDIELDAATGITRFYLAGDTNDYASLTVAANGVTTLATFDDGGTVGHLTIDPDGELLLEPTASGIKIKEIADKSSETAGYGQIWVKDDDPNSLWFTNDDDEDYKISPYRFAVTTDQINLRMSSVNQYYVGNQSLGTGVAAADFGYREAPYASYNSVSEVTLKSWRWVGGLSSSVDWEFELWDVTIPSNGSVTASVASKVGDTQSISATSGRFYTMGQTDLSVNIAAGHSLYVVIRYTSGSGTKYTYGSVTLEMID